MINKIFAVYKPKGPTSHDIVDEIRKITSEKRVGHAGTLDPLARGVLVVGVGREATKKLGEVVKKEKEYIAEIKFGEESSTDDEEGEKKAWSVGKTPRLDEVGEAVKSFRGFIAQTPPIYSAIKIGGQKAYELARENIKIELKPREIEIKEIEILDYEWPFLKIRVVTGPGVYIRALARDIGRELGVGGYLVDLERTRVGDFTKEKTIDYIRYQKRVISLS